jgi:hypothetical protein
MTVTIVLVEDLKHHFDEYELQLFNIDGQVLFPLFEASTGSLRTASAFFVYRKMSDGTVKAMGVEVNMLEKLAAQRHPAIAADLIEKVIGQFERLGAVIREGDPLPKPVRL